MTITQRAEETQDAAPRTRARGHLSLVEWNAEVANPAPKMTDPVRRTLGDRLFEGGVLVLMAATTLAVVASFAHL